MKALKFADLHKDNRKYEEAFRKLLGQVERLSCLGYDEDQSKYALCAALWFVVKGYPCSLHALNKPCI